MSDLSELISGATQLVLALVILRLTGRVDQIIAYLKRTAADISEYRCRYPFERRGNE